MRLNQFESLLDRHGARLDAWPSDMVAAARLFLAGSEPARLLLAEAQAVDAAFRTELGRPVRAPRQLIDKIMSRIVDEPDEPPASAA